jgi:hypothetical protein
MRRSLDRLRALAARLLDLRTMERVIDPLLERRRWTLIAGHVVFLKTVALCVIAATSRRVSPPDVSHTPRNSRANRKS